MKKVHRVCYRFNTEIKEYHDTLHDKIIKKIKKLYPRINPSSITRVFYLAMKKEQEIEDFVVSAIVKYVRENGEAIL